MYVNYCCFTSLNLEIIIQIVSVRKQNKFKRRRQNISFPFLCFNLIETLRNITIRKDFSASSKYNIIIFAKFSTVDFSVLYIFSSRIY